MNTTTATSTETRENNRLDSIRLAAAMRRGAGF